MNSKLIIVSTVLITLLLSGCGQWCVDKSTIADGNAYKINPNSRTWTVYDADDEAHMLPEQKFRIQQDGDEIKLIPLYDLRYKWKMRDHPGASILLTKLDLKDRTGVEEFYCGIVELDTSAHRETPNKAHGLLISLTKYDTLDITFFVPGDKSIKDDPERKSLIARCMNREFHGGLAHAEN